MSEEMEPVASAPEEGNAVSIAADNDNVESHSLNGLSSDVKKWPWAIVAGIALVAGVGGFALGQSGDGHRINVNTIGDHRSFNQDGQPGKMGQDGQKGQMPMGPHCEDTTGNHAAVKPDGSCPTGFTLDDKGAGMMGNRQGMLPGNGQMPMGPHCEDTTGAHAPVNADGSCPTGFTLDDKSKGGNLVAPSPTASGATS